jgi:thiamine-phosphate diphosphorylase
VVVRIGRFHVLTDTVIQTRWSHVEIAEAAIRGGAEAIQFRQKRGETAEMIREASAVRDVCRRGRVLFIVNDRLDVALAVDADGIHLGRDDLPIALARRALGPHRIIGGSAGSVEEAIAGEREGADYLGCGPIFVTATKPDAGDAAGPELLRLVRNAVDLPLLAIGGIDETNLAASLAAGADGVAVVSAVCARDDPEAAARRIRLALDAGPPAPGGALRARGAGGQR